jgi:glycerol-3-phosphate dehydrogenase
MVRRSRIYYEAPDQGLEVLDKVADIMAAGLGWDPQEQARQVEDYRRTVEQSRLYKA